MPQLPSLIDMLKAGVHFGHQTSKWHPKMRSYIYTVRHGIHIVDLEQTARQLDRALIAVRDTVAAGGIVLFASLKDQANQAVREAALEVGRFLGRDRPHLERDDRIRVSGVSAEPGYPGDHREQPAVRSSHPCPLPARPRRPATSLPMVA